MAGFVLTGFMSKKTDQPLQIAIDGPVAAGKSTIAKLLADKLKLTYIDTGAMYRALALAAKQAGVDWQDEVAVVEVAKNIKLRLARPTGSKKDGRPVSVYLNGQDVSWKIRELEMGEGASIVATYARVRQILVKKQQEMCHGKRVVMEGRDICSVVLPHADLKIFMSAKQKERIKRKQEQLKKIGEKATRKQVKKDLVSRDTREMNREIDPLKPTPDAWQLDTTRLSVAEVVAVIQERVLALSSVKNKYHRKLK